MEGTRPRGFSLTELLCALAILAGLTGWALPSFRDMVRNAARTREVTGFLQAVHLARSEAIKRNGVVSLCPSPDGTGCVAGPAWQAGWIVFVNLDRDSPAVRDAGEDLLRSYPAWPDGSIDSNRGTLSFRPFGQSGVTATVTFCDRRGSAAARAVIISQTGRPRVTDRSSTGGPLTCT
jgi:type IV fimbrial biogenesis protein FimT